MEEVLSKEELENKPEFKILKSYLKKIYPFVVDVVIIPNYREYKHTLFFDFIIDLFKYEKYIGTEFKDGDLGMIYFTSRSDDGEDMVDVVMRYSGPDKDDAERLEKEIDKKIRSFHNSNVFDKEDKLPYSHLTQSGVIISKKNARQFLNQKNSK